MELVIAAIAGWAGLVAADPNSTASWVGGAAALTLLTIAIGFNFRNQRAQQREIQELKQENIDCNWRTSVLVEVLNANAIAVPASFWGPPPKEVAERMMRRNSQDQPNHTTWFQFGGKEDGKASYTLISVVTLGVIAFVAFSIVTYTLLVIPIRDVSESVQSVAANTKSDRCVADLTADYFVAIKRALAAPPAPNAERSAALIDLDRTAERIRHRVDICSDGEADTYTPAPVPRCVARHTGSVPA